MTEPGTQTADTEAPGAARVSKPAAGVGAPPAARRACEEKYDTDFVAAPVGLANTGAVCYLNSLIQSLVSLPVVVKAIRSTAAESCKTSTSHALRALIDKMFGAEGALPLVGVLHETPTIVEALNADLIRAKNTPLGTGQACAEEALTLMLDQLPDRMSRPFVTATRCELFCGGCLRRVSTTTDVTYVSFFGHINATATPPTTPAAFAEALRRHTEVTEGYHCDGCRRETTGHRRYTLSMVSSVIIVQFHRFTPALHAKRHYVPDEFTLPAKKGGHRLFRRVAEVEHFGTPSGGHYIARARRGARVVEFDDAAPPRDSAFAPRVGGVYLVAFHFMGVVPDPVV